MLDHPNFPSYLLAVPTFPSFHFPTGLLAFIYSRASYPSCFVARVAALPTRLAKSSSSLASGHAFRRLQGQFFRYLKDFCFYFFGKMYRCNPAARFLNNWVYLMTGKTGCFVRCACPCVPDITHLQVAPWQGCVSVSSQCGGRKREFPAVAADRQDGEPTAAQSI